MGATLTIIDSDTGDIDRKTQHSSTHTAEAELRRVLSDWGATAIVDEAASGRTRIDGARAYNLHRQLAGEDITAAAIANPH